MTRRRFHIYGCRLPLRTPLELSSGTLAHRDVLLLRLIDEDGAEGWGEVSPLPGYSRESAEEALRHLELALRLWCSRFPNPLLTIRSPSVCCGIEQAIRHMELSRAGLELHELTAAGTRDRIRICALMTGDALAQMAQGIRSGLAGVRTIKIKVGRRPFAMEAELVRQLCQDLAPGIRIRLDANRAWTLEDAVAFCKAVEGLPIDLIEEPVQNPVALPAFHARAGLPIALDETLGEVRPEEWLRIAGVAAVVLKPTILGGFDACRTIAAQARGIGAYPIVSSCFESGVGTWGCAALAAELQRIDEAAGLDPYTRLADDVLKERLDFINGHLYMAGIRRLDLRMDLLKELRNG